ncbi:MAG: hypothetical protein QF449_15925, partial [Alphaproteobacteria bacterium]|nr:hypothetical protein [Alphaproteobacteria bacterium]
VYDIDSYSRIMLPPHEISVSSGKWGLNISGWEEWELDENMKVTSALGWFDADDYRRQAGGAVLRAQR